MAFVAWHIYPPSPHITITILSLSTTFLTVPGDSSPFPPNLTLNSSPTSSQAVVNPQSVSQLQSAAPLPTYASSSLPVSESVSVQPCVSFVIWVQRNTIVPLTCVCVCVCVRERGRVWVEVIHSPWSWGSCAGLVIASFYPPGESLQFIIAWSMGKAVTFHTPHMHPLSQGGQ